MFTPIAEILEDVRAGKFVILVDDEDRENEGDLVLAAQHVTPERINQITRMAGGYLCLSLTGADCDRLNLHPQTMSNTSVRGTPFTVSIDGHPRHGVGTGISAQDRAKTVQLAIDPKSTPEDFVRPGHINPLRSRDGGVLVRIGQTEGAVDLARLAGLHPSALIIEIVREDGTMARRPDLELMCKQHGIRMCSIEQLIQYRLQRERLVERMAPEDGTPVRTEEGEFTLFAYQSTVDALPHVVLTMGGVGKRDGRGAAVEQDAPTLVRMHRRNVLGDIFGAVMGDEEASGAVLKASMRAIAKEGRGAIVYLRPEGVGDDLHGKLTAINRGGAGRGDAHDLTSPRGIGASVVPMHLREFGIGGQILRDLGISRMRLLTNHAKDYPGLDAFGLEIVEQVALRGA